jgi:hypothetical protein
MDDGMRSLISAAVAAAAVVGLACLWSSVSTPAAAGDRQISRDDLSARAEAKAKSRRAPLRLRVTPRCLYRTETLDYPPPYDCEYPGPGFVRQCVSRLVQDTRFSGTVFVPRMWCWWERG